MSITSPLFLSLLLFRYTHSLPPPPLPVHFIDTTVSQIEDAFNRLSAREDIAIILINQHVAGEIRHVLSGYSKTIPTVLEIPSKDVP